MSNADEIYRIWTLRDKDSRTVNDAEKLADESWAMGLRLHRNRNTHNQLVMQSVRSRLAR
ncbi:hypothetical protein J2125_003932 [Erwinia toletana]|uniref:Uncharacterized protein n=1 Tax=Winslowiella toletana TaxID=92490 RepID=A0ABS4PF48_9GAMM|nr:hypothetical protein [Winslowiella toletana]